MTSASEQGRRSNRKGHYSCDFCRSRKLRCDRPLPCTNCVSRGKHCHFAVPNTSMSDWTPPLSLGEQIQPSLPVDSPHAIGPDNREILVEILALKELVQKLESRVAENTSRIPDEKDLAASSAANSSTTEDTVPISVPNLGQFSDIVTHLDRLSMGQSFYEPAYDNDLVFRIERIQNIPQAPTYITHLGKVMRCIWLPRHDEASIMLEKYITKLSSIQHITHTPSLRASVNELYHQFASQESVKIGQVILFLSIIASTAYMWTSQDDKDDEDPLFTSPNQANEQTNLWIKAIYDMLNTAQNSPELTLETIQGILVLAFLIGNLEGISLRFRSLISTSLLLSRHLGLHRLDYDSHEGSAYSIKAEMSRRVWWYLVATDWLLSARYGSLGNGMYQANLRRMMVKRPRNMNDADLHDDELNLGQPTSQPTEMSYFLQRIRIAEISRSIIDPTPFSSTDSTAEKHLAHVMAMDAKLDRMIYDLPSFFHLDNYGCTLDSNTYDTYIQAYFLNSIMYATRCKLHLSYLISGANNSPAYDSSRELCLDSARRLISAETQLERSKHSFARIRLRFSGILYGVFLASIVLLINTCVNGVGSDLDEVNEALYIINDAKSHSQAAKNLHDAFTQILAIYQGQSKDLPSRTLSTQIMNPSAIPIMSNGTIDSEQRPDHPALMMDPAESMMRGPAHESFISVFSGQILGTNDQIIPGAQLAQSLGELIDGESFQWDDLGYGVDPSSIL